MGLRDVGEPEALGELGGLVDAVVGDADGLLEHEHVGREGGEAAAGDVEALGRGVGEVPEVERGDGDDAVGEGLHDGARG
ncbi:MAG: hypothetical protein U0324_08415 [Polyangiales bacterium]